MTHESCSRLLACELQQSKLDCIALCAAEEEGEEDFHSDFQSGSSIHALACRDGSIGFLKTSNRINVMLSRAKHGMYILGHAETLTANKKSNMWHEVTVQRLSLLRLLVLGHHDFGPCVCGQWTIILLPVLLLHTAKLLKSNH